MRRHLAEARRWLAEAWDGTYTGSMADRAVEAAQVEATLDVAAGLRRVAEAIYTLSPAYDYPLAMDPVGGRALRPEDVHDGHYGRRVIIRWERNWSGQGHPPETVLYRGRALVSVERTAYAGPGHDWQWTITFDVGAPAPHVVVIPVNEGVVVIEVEREDAS